MKSRVRATKGDKFRKEALKRIRAGQTAAGRALAEPFLKAVKKRVKMSETPDQPHTAWVKLYKDALVWLETKDGLGWAVAGFSLTKLQTVPAATTQIKFMDGGGQVIDVVRPYIWTVDTLPAISGGYRADAIVRPASQSEMESHRATLQPELPRIIEQLKNAGAQVIDAFPTVNGQVLMDLKFLQLRMEHGLGGFPRVPHWRPAVSEAKNKAKGWVRSSHSAIQDALNTGKVGDPEHVLSADMKKLLEKARKTRWV